MNVIRKMRVRSKVLCVLALWGLALTALALTAGSLAEQRMMTDRVAQLRAAVDMAAGIAANLQAEVVAGKLTLAQAQEQFRERGHGLKYAGDQGYIIAYYHDGLVLLMGANPKIENTVTGAKTERGVTIARETLDTAAASPDGGVLSYRYQRPGGTELFQKLLFARRYAPWDVTISSGLYIDDIEADVHALLFRLALIAVALFTGATVLSWLIRAI